MTNDTPKLSVFCNNVNRSNYITHSILNDLASPDSKYDIFIATEPWIGTVRCDTNEKGTVNHLDWRCITPTIPSESNVTLYYRKNAPFRVTPLPHLDFANESILPVKITIQDNFSIILVAIYNSPTTHEALPKLLGATLPEEPIILCGDFNLHAPEWDNTVERADARANIFQDWLMDNTFQVLNDPSKPTYHGHQFQFAKVIDLAIANAEFFCDYDLSPIQVHTENHFVSDHYPISFDIFTFTEPFLPPSEYNLLESQHQDWNAAISPIFDTIYQDIQQPATPESLDKIAESIITAITTSV